MTATSSPETPQDWLARLEATPLILTGGRALQDFLARDTSLGPERAKAALREYRRFLALALSAPDRPRMPGPMIAQLWQLHREDSAAYAAFLADAGQGAQIATRRAPWNSARQGTTASQAYTETRRAYEDAFGPAPRHWWPPRPKPPGRARLSHDLAWQAAAFLLLLWLYGLGETPLGRVAVLLVFALGFALTLWREAREPSAFRVYGPATTLIAG